MIRLFSALLSVLLLAAVAGLPAPRTALAQGSTTDPRFFPETQYRIDNESFWSFFQGRGGIQTFGYPVSRTFVLDGFTVQIFQRIVMQLRPDGSVATLNLLDEGLLPYTRINGSVFPAADPALTQQTPSPASPTYAEDIVTFVVQNAPNVFAGQPVNFEQTFRTTVSYEEAFPQGDGPASLLPLMNLEIWGAPTSRPTADPTNGNFIYQRFQRGIMHYDAATGQTLGLLLADYLKSVLTGQNLPADLEAQARDSRFYRQYDPSRPLSIARPAELPSSDLTNAFVTQTPVVGGVPVTPPPSGRQFAYGFQAHLYDISQQARDMTVGLVAEAGFGWIKHQVSWRAIETAPGVYNWAELDAIVDTARARNIKLLFAVVDAPEFYRGPTTGHMPADPATFERFMNTLAGRYAGRVQAYQIWNEPNIELETGPGNVSPANYLQLLKAAYTGTKAADVDALVLLGPPSPTGLNIPGRVVDDVVYLEQLYAINNGEVRAYFDAMAAHPSGFSNPPDCTPATPECSLSGGFNEHPSFYAFTRVAQYRDVMVGNGDAHKQIWFTEFGYASTGAIVPGYEYALYVSEEQQAEFLVRAFEIAQSLDYVGGMMVWNLNFQMIVPPTDEKWAFGVLRSDFSGRPAYHALFAMPKPNPR